MGSLDAVEIIAAKRDGLPLTGEAVSFLVDAFTRGQVPDYQMSAFLMAVCLRGMSAEETAALTGAMLRSGRVLSFSGLPRVGDKHSTGGVGDATSFIVGPVCAALGVAVPMIAGRGLGHTGGTVDKLESIPGLRTDLAPSEIEAQVREMGLCMAGQSAEIAPADRRLYALRDVTCTVESVPLIAASIMSKKLAEGLDALVMDVKCGRGAFMKEEAAARELAKTIVDIGAAHGVRVTALLTAMDQPLGRAAGNALEIAEAAALLRGEEPPGTAELLSLSLELSAHLAFLSGAALSVDEARGLARRALASGRAFEVFSRMVAAQDGDASVLERPERLPQALVRRVVAARETGFVTRLDALGLGKACVRLGAGRLRLDDRIDPAAGMIFLAREGDAVKAGEPVLELHAASESLIDAVLPLVDEALAVGPQPPPIGLLMRGVLSAVC